MYSINGNSIYRQGELFAEIKANGLIEFINPENEKYRLPVWKFLDSIGRIQRIEPGTDLAVYFETEEIQETQETQTEQNETESVENVLKTAEVQHLSEIYPVIKMYSINGNSIYRQGELFAEIKANGLIEFINPENEKYRLSVWKFLDSIGRIQRIEPGTDLAVYFETEEIQETQETQTEQNETESVENVLKTAEVQHLSEIYPVIKTVRELRDVIEKMTGEAAPFLSKSLGDQTPEVWDYFKRHIDMVETVKSAYVVKVKLNRLYEEGSNE